MRPCSRVAQQIVCLLKIPSHNGKDSAPSHNPGQGYCFLFSETFERFVEIGRKALCDLGCLSPQAGHFGTGSPVRSPLSVSESGGGVFALYIYRRASGGQKPGLFTTGSPFSFGVLAG
jgi:hypothetical protein